MTRDGGPNRREGTNGPDEAEGREAPDHEAQDHEARVEPRPGHDPGRREAIGWLWRLPVLLAAGAGSWGLYEGIRTHFFKRAPDPTPTFEDGPTVTVGPLAAFAEDWDAKEFRYDGEPAIAVRLPGPIPGGLDVERIHLAAFSRVCTHEACEVSLNRDTETIAFAFNYRAEGPQFVCPCHLSVFDPERAGRAVAGPAVLPLPRLRLVRDGGALLATGREDVAAG